MPPKKQASNVEKKKITMKISQAETFKISGLTKEELEEDIDVFLTSHNPYVSDKCIEFDYKTLEFKPVLDYKKPVVYFSKKSSIRLRPEIVYGELYEEGVEEKKEERMRNKFNFRSLGTQSELKLPNEQKESIDETLFPILKFSGMTSKAEILAAYEEHENSRRKTRSNWMKTDINVILKQVARKHIKIFNGNFYFKTRFNNRIAPVMLHMKKCFPNQRLYSVSDVWAKYCLGRCQRSRDQYFTLIPGKSRYYLRLCERMLDQNMSDAIIDFSYYDNPNDEFQPNVGSLLPLWTVGCRVARDMQVTAISWNFRYTDLFAVGYRTRGDRFDVKYDDDEDLGAVREFGCICVYSLKGPAWPERIIQCPSGVCCLQFHVESPHLLAASLAGGDLFVFDLRKNDLTSSGHDSKYEIVHHQDSVCEVQWLKNQRPQKLCSISNDGKIINWFFLMNYLYPQELVTNLKIKNWSIPPPPKGLETNLPTKTLPRDTVTLNTTGVTVSVNNSNSDLLLVGTVTGLMHQYSFDDKLCTSSYDGHNNSVSRVRWNPFHPRVFLSCSEDLTVQVWDHSLQHSVFEFFFDVEVIDAVWAPFSSTLFAAISGNATVHVFDLAINKMESIGSYTVYTPKQNIRLTKLEIHPRKPVIIVGDVRGNVILLKLSPNLRSSLKSLSTLDWTQFVSSEIEKMNRILNVSTDPKS